MRRLCRVARARWGGSGTRVWSATTAGRGGRGPRPEPPGVTTSTVMRAMARFFRSNPQALVLLIICVVLGLGTFIAVLVSLSQHSNGSLNGEPSGVIAMAGRLLP
jgi:hypothetical protein